MKTDHILLSGQGAEEFADLHKDKVERVNQEYFHVQSRYDAYLAAIEKDKVELDHSSPHAFATKGETPKVEEKGTVGCVALDVHGNLAGTLYLPQINTPVNLIIISCHLYRRDDKQKMGTRGGLSRHWGWYVLHIPIKYNTFPQ